MKLTPPKNITFWASVLLALLGFVGQVASVPVLSTYPFWFVFVGFVVLVLGLLLKGF
ncbi:hypothetical protein ACFLXB_04680 [Chloroflexota bacterium]